MVQSRTSIREMTDKFDQVIEHWKESTEIQASDDDIKTVNDLSQALQPRKHKADRERLRKQLMDVITMRRDMLYSCPGNVENIDDYLSMLKDRIKTFNAFCVKLLGLNAVQGKGSGKDGKKHVRELLDLCVLDMNYMLDTQFNLNNLFYVAAARGIAPLVEQLIRLVTLKGDEELRNLVNCQSELNGATPLIVAISNCHEDVVKQLIDLPVVDVNIKTREYGKSPLQIAIPRYRQAGRMVDLLLRRDDIDLFHKDKNGLGLEHAATQANLTTTVYLSKIKPKMIEKANQAFERLPDLLPKLENRMSEDDLSSLISDINNYTRCLSLGEFKGKRSEVRECIVNILKKRVYNLINDKNPSANDLYDELRELTRLRANIGIIQGNGGVPPQIKKKDAMIKIIHLLENVSGKLIEKIDEGKVTSITHAIFFLAKGDFNKPELLSKYMLDYFMADDDLSISYAKAAMSCLGEAQRKLVKKNLLDYVKDVASIYQNDLNETTNWIKVLANQCGEGDKKVALFEVFRSGSPEELDHNTNTRTWKKFLEVMKTGNFSTDDSLCEAKRSSQPSFVFFGRQSDCASNQTELQTLSKSANADGANAKPEILKK